MKMMDVVEYDYVENQFLPEILVNPRLLVRQQQPCSNKKFFRWEMRLNFTLYFN